MGEYVALLRGINVGAHKRVSMADVRQCFEALAFGNVQTILTTGNVLFQAEKRDAARLAGVMEAALARTFGFPIGVITRTETEMAMRGKAQRPH